MRTEEINYSVDGCNMVGFMAYVEKIKGKRPAVLVCHAFEGRNDLACEYAKKFAKLGYVGFAVDMYGDKQVESNLEGCMEKLTPLFNDRKILQKRILAAFNVVSNLENVDEKKIGAIGFCFGGMCALDLARSGADVKGVVSVHGVLKKPPQKDRIKAKVLALHGFLDPQVSKEDLEEFTKEMQEQEVDWQLHYYGLSKHAFTDPKADKIGGPEMGREYNEAATLRAFNSAKNFFDEVF